MKGQLTQETMLSLLSTGAMRTHPTRMASQNQADHTRCHTDAEPLDSTGGWGCGARQGSLENWQSLGKLNIHLLGNRAIPFLDVSQEKPNRCLHRNVLCSVTPSSHAQGTAEIPIRTRWVEKGRHSHIAEHDQATPFQTRMKC